MNPEERRRYQVEAVAEMLKGGKTQGAIAEALGVSRWTVNKRVKEARKLVGEVVEDAEKAGVSPEEAAASAELKALRAKASRGLDVGPQVSVVLSRQIQSQLVRELGEGKLNAREAAQALSQVEVSRKSAEAAIDLRSKMAKELSEELLSAVDRVVPSTVYERVVRELERVRKRQLT